MSLFTKTIHVMGERIHRNNRSENTLAKEIDNALDKVFSGNKGNVVNLINKVDWASNQALIIVLFEPPKTASRVADDVKNKGGKE